MLAHLSPVWQLYRYRPHRNTTCSWTGIGGRRGKRCSKSWPCCRWQIHCRTFRMRKNHTLCLVNGFWWENPHLAIAFNHMSWYKMHITYAAANFSIPTIFSCVPPQWTEATGGPRTTMMIVGIIFIVAIIKTRMLMSASRVLLSEGRVRGTFVGPSK
jgi:hypothetical protein